MDIHPSHHHLGQEHSSSLTNAFVYGTLQFPEVLRALIGRVPDHAPATLTGYCRHCVAQHVFPAIVPSLDATVDGYILQGLTKQEMRLFDAFEDEEYIKTAGTVVNTDTGREEHVIYYVWHPSLEDKLVREPWDPEEFRTRHLDQYERMVEVFAAEQKPWKQW